MNVKEVKKALIDKGWTIIYLAQIIGVHRVHLSLVINGHRKGKKIWPKIAAALDLKYREAA